MPDEQNPDAEIIKGLASKILALCDGYENTHIATALCLSVATVATSAIGIGAANDSDIDDVCALLAKQVSNMMEAMRGDQKLDA